ncbi:acyl transferase/acyl hydrolase/lysophospholipase [Flagelloscypha sp. PMI_526]|nr:acyl transferase/acyl hydrolase/lysophospholipase [Flagelloscypha sp. PMI_526]
MSTDSEDSNGPEALPSDYFDLIVGSGDGGWIAVMLGRLRMTVSQTTQTYLNIHSSVHHGTEHIDAEARSAELESRLKHLVETQSLSQNPDEKMWTSESKNLRCHTAILTMTAHNVTAPTLFRTYRTRNHRTKNCALWQAMRASSADPNLFTPARIGDQSYISASMIGHSNPVDYALSEAEGLFPGIPITCIVSLGAGHPGAISLAGSDMTSYAEAAINLAKDAEQKSQLAAKHLQAPKRTYYRFNVEQGLQHYLLGAGTGYEEARAHTMAYQRREEVHSLMDMVVAELLAPPPRRVKTQGENI